MHTHAGIKSALLCLALAVAASQSASAAVVTDTIYSNAVNYCQAFTPGPSNTIRNRVVGSENIGAPIAVACNFAYATMNQTQRKIKRIFLYASNGSGASVTMSCTLLTGLAASPINTGDSYAVTKTRTFATIAAFEWAVADNPTPGADDLGNSVIGINCILPTNVTLTTISLYRDFEDGL